MLCSSTKQVPLTVSVSHRLTGRLTLAFFDRSAPTFSGFLWCGFGFSIHHRTSTIVLRGVDAVLRGPEHYPQLRPGLRVGWHCSGEPKRNMFRLSRLRHPRHGLVAHYWRIALRSWATIISIYLSILYIYSYVLQ